jgi:predicted DNA-binding WGR domain protein
LTKDWYHNPEDVLSRIEKLMQGQEAAEATESADNELTEPVEPVPKLIEPATSARDFLKSEASPAEDKDVVKLSAAGPAVSNPGSARRFEFTSGSSNKFWEISPSGNSFTVRFGRLGTAGQSQTKSFADEAKAKHEADHLVAEKLKKGYQEKTD